MNNLNRKLADQRTPEGWRARKLNSTVSSLGIESVKLVLESDAGEVGFFSPFPDEHRDANMAIISAAQQGYDLADLVLLTEDHIAQNRDLPTAEQWTEIVKLARQYAKKLEEVK